MFWHAGAQAANARVPEAPCPAADRHGAWAARAPRQRIGVPPPPPSPLAAGDPCPAQILAAEEHKEPEGCLHKLKILVGHATMPDSTFQVGGATWALARRCCPQEPRMPADPQSAPETALCPMPRHPPSLPRGRPPPSLPMPTQVEVSDHSKGYELRNSQQLR